MTRHSYSVRTEPSSDHLHERVAEVLGILADYLTVGDLFRLHRALGRVPQWPSDVVNLIMQRMGIRKRYWRCDTGMDVLRRRMNASRYHCAECACKLRRVTRVCASCRADPTGYRAMWTREDIQQHHARFPIRNCRHRIRIELRVVARSHTGRHYFWKRDVLAMFTRHSSRSSLAEDGPRQ